MHFVPSAAALAAFQSCFGHPADRVVQAPGRVNLIGEHTDYNDGFVLPCAIDRGTIVAARAREDMKVRVVAADHGSAVDEFSLDEPIVPRSDMPWANYVRGTVQQLLAYGATLRGAELAISGNVPQGAGLSSSASLEVAVIQAFKTLFRLDDLDAMQMALVAQQAENSFVGCACGIMDQLISARGVAAHALLIDCRSLQVESVPLPTGFAVMIVHSRIRRGLVGSEYNVRRKQCEEAARHFGVKALRDVDLSDFERHAMELNPVVRRRAHHVITENQRTLDAARALAVGDMERVGMLMAMSHESMRNDFEVSVPPVDELVAILQGVIGDAGGARMTGGGFGGCVVALLPEDMVDAARAEVGRRYRAPGGEPAHVYVCHASWGAGELGECRLGSLHSPGFSATTQ